MTEAEKQTLKKFDAKVRNLLASYVALQRENADLYEELEKKESEIQSLQEQANNYKKEYNNLKLAKMIEISDTDFKDAKQRITNLVREVNNCINLLNAQYHTYFVTNGQPKTQHKSINRRQAAFSYCS